MPSSCKTDSALDPGRCGELPRRIGVADSITGLGFGFLMAAQIHMAKPRGAARASTERIADTMDRIVRSIDRNLQDIKDLLRGQYAGGPSDVAGLPSPR